MLNSLSSKMQLRFQGQLLLANTITTSILENEHTQLIFEGGCSLSPPQSTTTSSWPTLHPPLKTSRCARFRGWLLFAYTITSTTLENKHTCSFSRAAALCHHHSPPPPALGRHHIHLRKRADALVFRGGCSLPTPSPLPPSKTSMYACFRGLPTTPSTFTLKNEHVCSFSRAAYHPYLYHFPCDTTRSLISHRAFLFHIK